MLKLSLTLKVTPKPPKPKRALSPSFKEYLAREKALNKLRKTKEYQLDIFIDYFLHDNGYDI
jgi:hypothetical protein